MCNIRRAILSGDRSCFIMGRLLGFCLVGEQILIKKVFIIYVNNVAPDQLVHPFSLDKRFGVRLQNLLYQ